MSDYPQKDALPQYRSRPSAVIILALGILVMTLGVITIIIGIISFFDESFFKYFTPVVLIPAGLFVVVLGALILVVGNLSEDVHKLLYDYEYIAYKNADFQRYTLQHLQEVDRDHNAIKRGIATISSKME